MDGSILSHTRSIAAVLASKFADDPTGELDIWVTTAQQREAMVVMLYDAAAVEDRLPKRAGEPEVVSVARKAIAGIWAQERAHTTLVESLRVLDEQRLTAMRSLLGAIEGGVAHHATAYGWIGTFATSLVGFTRAIGLAPEFTTAFRALSPRDFFRFSRELEGTAKEGYARILELLASLGSTDARALKFGVTGPYEFAKTHAEECFHAAVFEQLEHWLEPNGLTFTDVAAPDAVLRLRALAVEHLSLASASFGPAALAAVNRPWTKSISGASELVSDGGLGELFEEFGVRLPPLAIVSA
jgi:hypothetical protein